MATASDWPFAGVLFDSLEINTTCHGSDQRFGNAFLSHQALTSPPVSTNLGGGKQRVACAATTVGGSLQVPLEACVTHLDDDVTNARLQLAVATDFAYSHASGKALLFGGDFNLLPNDPAFNGVYASGDGSTGHFQELDQCSAATGGVRTGGPPTYACNRYTHLTASGSLKKHDYMFFKKDYAKNADPRQPMDLGLSVSDHYVYYGEMDICDSAAC